MDFVRTCQGLIRVGRGYYFLHSILFSVIVYIDADDVGKQDFEMNGCLDIVIKLKGYSMTPFGSGTHYDRNC